ncbi:MAG TPA: hypothetical protein VE398_07495 [Acidobacteriota bacterium]|nr:hypothetical protein [Acidobacteriota bacterium]
MRETCGISSAVDIFPLDAEFQWTEDMVQTVDPACIQMEVPERARLAPLPELVNSEIVAQAETHFLQYLLRYYKLLIYRNFALNLYSNPGETLKDFTSRCVEILGESFRLDLDQLREVFDRKLSQAKGKYIKLKEQGEFDPPQHPMQFKGVLHQVSERIAQMFLSAELNLQAVPYTRPLQPSPGTPELEDRLNSVEMEAHNSINQVLSTYQDRARNIDEYIVRPNLKDIHLVRSCILWVPAGEPAR